MLSNDLELNRDFPAPLQRLASLWRPTGRSNKKVLRTGHFA
jgi:hypothetical protein